MKKGPSSILTVLITFLLVLCFSGCENLKVSNIKANNAFKTANDFYSQEKYKKAINEYKLALKYNPNLEIAYLYLGVCYSSLYRSGLPSPENNEQYNKMKKESEDLLANIEENKKYIENFEKNLELKKKIEDNNIIKKTLKEAENSLKNIARYNDYQNNLSENRRNIRRIERNEAYLNRISEKKESDITLEEHTLVADKAQENEDLSKEVKKNELRIKDFEQNEIYLTKKEEIKEIKENINKNEESLKQNEDYDEYIKNIKKKEENERKIRSNNSYIIKLEKNVEYGKNAVDYLLKAKNNRPEDERIINALGDIYDKMRNYEQTEKYFEMVLDRSKDDPKAYYTLANFYTKYQKPAKAEKMYKKRIELDPNEPSGYLHYARYLQNMGKWTKSINNHEKRIAIFVDPTIISTYKDIDKATEDIETVQKKAQYMENVKKNIKIDKKQRTQIINKILDELKEFKSTDELKKDIENKKKEVEQVLSQSAEKIKNFPEEKRKKIAEAYYWIGYVLWGQSYYTDTNIMSAEERDKVITKGIRSLDKAIEMNPDFSNPYAYKGLLYREKIKVNPLKREEYIRLNEEFNAQFIKIYKRNKKREAYQKKLEKDAK